MVFACQSKNSPLVEIKILLHHKCHGFGSDTSEIIILSVQFTLSFIRFSKCKTRISAENFFEKDTENNTF